MAHGRRPIETAVGGIIAQRLGLSAVLPYMMLLSVVVFVFYEAAMRSSAKVRPVELLPVAGD